MQPDQDNHSPEQWQPPVEQGSQAPFATSGVEQPSAAPVQPIVTLSDDAPLPASSPSQPSQPPQTDPEMTPVHWQAAEYIHRPKDGLWYVWFGVVVAVLMAIAIILMNAITFAVLIPVMAAALVVYSRRPPRMIDYTLSRQGLHVNDHLYPFAEFKSFVVIHGDDEYSVLLVPTKRFKPGVSVYFPEEAGEAIVDMLAARLPMSESHIDFVDQIIRKLRI